MKRVAISTLGCKTNQFESAAMIEQLIAAGYLVVPFTESSDYYIINSCTVTARTDAETRRLIRRARRLNPAARIVATGCYAQVAPGELEKMPELDCVLGNQEKQNISSLLETTVHAVSDIATVSQAGQFKLTSFAEHTRAFLQIQNGCNSFCSYCIVPYARGRSRSVNPEEILQGVRDLAANGFQEVVLTGIHLGAYGLDLPNPSSLTELVRQIDGENIVSRLRIGSVEPNEVSDELLNLMATSKNICPHLHLPLQSGSDSVLNRMGRLYTSGFFRDLMVKVLAIMPDAFIGADVIAGFPGESDEEFEETVQLLEELPFSDLHIFPYSSRQGTRAADMPGHVSAHIITERAKRLRKIGVVKKNWFIRKFIGREVNILVQKYDLTTGFCHGFSHNYITVTFPGYKDFVNNEVRVKILNYDGTICSGEIATRQSHQVRIPVRTRCD